MRNFLYSFIARIILVLGGSSGVLIACWPRLVERLGLSADLVALVITIPLFLIVEILFILIPEINLQRTQKRMGNALFYKWLKDLRFENGQKVPGIRINVMLFRWYWKPNLSFHPFKKWIIEYATPGPMREDKDRAIVFKLTQGWVGFAYRENRGGIAHCANLQNRSATEKREFLRRKIKNGGLGMTKAQIAQTNHVLEIVTVLLVESNKKAFGALNVDAISSEGAEALALPEVQGSIVKLAKYARSLYGRSKD